MITVSTAGPLHAPRVEEMMTREVIVVRHHSQIGAAVDAAFRGGKAQVVVVDEDDRLLDVVPTQLLTMALLGQLVARQDLIDRVLDADPPSVGPQTDVRDAVTLMRERSAEVVAVIDDGGYVQGLLSWSDIGIGFALGR